MTKTKKNTKLDMPQQDMPENARLKRIVRLVGILMDGDASPGLLERIRGWFAKAGGSAIVEDGIAEYSKSFKPESLPMKGETLRRYNAVAAKLGLPAEVNAAPVRKLRRVPALWRVAAVLVPFIAIGSAIYFSGWFPSSEPDIIMVSPVAVVTMPDTQKHIYLPDGSEVWLKEESRIDYEDDFLNNRTVILTGGAYFSVAKMEGKPFRVKTDAMLATVTGTQFDIEDYGTDRTAAITLVSGSVSVDAGRKTYDLTPAQQLSVDKDTKDVTLETIELGVMKDWRKPTLFERSDLRTVLDYMSSRFRVNFIVQGTMPQRKNITVEFAHDITLDDALYVLSGVAGFTYDNDTETNTITIKLNE